MSKIDPNSPKSQEKSTEGPLSAAAASKMLAAPWTEAKLLREVKAGRLRTVVLQPNSTITRSGKQPRIGIFLADVLALDAARAKMADDIVALRGQLAEKVKERNHPSKVKRRVAQKVKGGGDETRN